MEKDDLLNLFQIPNIVVKIPTVWFLENSMINKEILYNAHLMVRYRTIQAYYENDEKWWKIYNKMQQLRVSQKSIIPREKAENEQAFKNLINNIEKTGFDDNYPIVINRKFRLIDGSHRLAAALYFKIPYVPVTMNWKTIDMDPEYSIKWFEDNGFQNIVNDIKKAYDEIIDRSKI